MKNVFAISFVVISILILSLKDTLNLAHIILHKLPNPFHHHHDFSHHHDSDMIEDDHHDDDEHDELDHDDHDSHEEYHHHTLRDHINLGADEEDDQRNSKEKTENSLGSDWDIIPFYSLNYQDFFKLIRIKNYFIIDYFNIHAHSPLAPPPELQ